MYRIPEKIYNTYAALAVVAFHDAAEAVVKEAENHFLMMMILKIID